jgi:hypothetical protein
MPLLGSYAASWSPDGSRLLYGVGAVGEMPAGIAIAERTNSAWNERVIVPNPFPSEPSWSPTWLDSDQFVFVRDAVMLVVANSDGSGERELARDRFFESARPCVAPDGSRAAVPLYSASAQLPGPLEELLVVSVDGATPPRRISTGVDGGLCSWQALSP